MGLEIVNVTWTGPPGDDARLLAELPDELRSLLDQEFSGFIQFHGGLQWRGACTSPAWHSLRVAWKGKWALHHAYPMLRAGDIPFAQDYLGNQFIYRRGNVIRIDGETGREQAPLGDLVMIGDDVSIDPVELPFQIFIALVQSRPEALGLKWLDAFLDSGHALDPGQLLHIYPPLCSKEARGGVALTLKAVDADERLAFLARAAARVAAAGAGAEVSFPLLR